MYNLKIEIKMQDMMVWYQNLDNKQKRIVLPSLTGELCDLFVQGYNCRDCIFYCKNTLTRICRPRYHITEVEKFIEYLKLKDV